MIKFIETFQNKFIKKEEYDVEIERNKKYEVRWVWYHTILAIELFCLLYTF